MGRQPLNKEAQKEIIIRLIKATQEISFVEGLEAVTIRKISTQAGLNIATLYKYFGDLDELLLFTCVDLFRSYANDLIQYEAQTKTASPEKTYMVTWELFCRYSFQYPEYINRLFFGKHSGRLAHVIKAYYDLFPEQLEGMSQSLKVMISSADLYKRNLEVLQPLLKNRASEQRMNLINDLTISYFYKLLNEKIVGGNQIDNTVQTQHMLDACRLLTSLS
ncbi:MAG: TetR/AcrR family transcriptional regulator [Clostridiaceae bacterium]|nr:TetR/AcrR family transcriptional regulator [Clostridiaceae bacterium]